LSREYRHGLDHGIVIFDEAGGEKFPICPSDFALSEKILVG
jgi:hypothetical protein